MAKQELGTEMVVYTCTECGGSGKIIGDWNALNQTAYASVGFSQKAAARQQKLTKRAYANCGTCKGEGKIFVPKK